MRTLIGRRAPPACPRKVANWASKKGLRGTAFLPALGGFRDAKLTLQIFGSSCAVRSRQKSASSWVLLGEQVRRLGILLHSFIVLVPVFCCRKA